MRILITGAAGFIGSHLADNLLEDGFDVVGLDNFNDYYDPALKRDRVAYFGHQVYKADLKEFDEIDRAFNKLMPDVVIHLAARAGVRDSVGNEQLYHQDNIIATQNLIQVCKMYNVKKVLYASTSSVYGGTPIPPTGWTEDEVTGHQLNPYAYTKYCNECQFKISGLNNVGLRFFTVYGPWGRPDMALYQFADSIVAGESIEAYNYGEMKRDFTYVGDIIEGIKLALFADLPSGEIFNIGRGKQVELMHFIDCISKELGRDVDVVLAPRHPADTLETWSDTAKLRELGYKPKVNIEVGVAAFIRWYKEYYGVN
jgi:UDP-glucuronate 4-epimerase|tara:strand:+ start:2181 stop:3119 length:939 start_codon:yes stop_codon:yes gene_type:complete